MCGCFLSPKFGCFLPPFYGSFIPSSTKERAYPRGSTIGYYRFRILEWNLLAECPCTALASVSMIVYLYVSLTFKPIILFTLYSQRACKDVPSAAYADVSSGMSLQRTTEGGQFSQRSEEEGESSAFLSGILVIPHQIFEESVEIRPLILWQF